MRAIERLPLLAAALAGATALAPMPGAAQSDLEAFGEGRRGWFEGQAIGEGRRGWFEERERLGRERFERGYRQGRQDERSVGERDRSDRNHGYGRNYSARERDRGSSGSDGLFD